MIAYYVTENQYCEYCKNELYIGEEVEIHEDGLFCDSVCLMGHLYEMSHAKHVYLTDNKIYRSVN